MTDLADFAYFTAGKCKNLRKIVQYFSFFIKILCTKPDQKLNYPISRYVNHGRNSRQAND